MNTKEKITNKSVRIQNKISRLYGLYTEGVSYRDIEKLLRKDVPGLFDFYVNRMRHPVEHKNSFVRKVLFARNLFIEFLLQLTPIRRIIFSVSLLTFIYGYFNNNWQWGVLGFLIAIILLAFELADKLTAKDELAVAREIQIALMPKTAPEHPYYKISCYTETAREVGGDYYDFIQNDNHKDNFYLIIGDISGKGMGAAIHMVQVQTILRSLINGSRKPKLILTALNAYLQQIFKKGSFFTASLAMIDESGNIRLCRAGHLPFIHYKKSADECFLIAPQGMGLGLTSNGIFENSLDEITFRPEEGDVLVFYTDGIIEAMNANNQFFGENLLKYLVYTNSSKNPDDITRSVVDSVHKFIDQAPVHDDLTLLVLKVC